MKIRWDSRVEVITHPIDRNKKLFPFLLVEEVKSEKTGFDVFSFCYSAPVFFQDF